MATPIIHHGRVLGVMAAQKLERRCFDNEEAAFFTTLATQLGGPVNHLLAKWDFSRRTDGQSIGRICIRGIPCAPGIAIGNIVLSQPADLQSTPDRRAPDIETEETAFQAAVVAAKQESLASSERRNCRFSSSVKPIHFSTDEGFASASIIPRSS
jgi:phosphotransferase system enzyme I (PtsP)